MQRKPVWLVLRDYVTYVMAMWCIGVILSGFSSTEAAILVAKNVVLYLAIVKVKRVAGV